MGRHHAPDPDPPELPVPRRPQVAEEAAAADLGTSVVRDVDRVIAAAIDRITEPGSRPASPP